MTAAIERRARAVRRLGRDARGVAASEFALLLPVMVTMLMGTVEVGNVFVLDRKVTSAVQTAADLVAQADQVTQADVTDILTAVDLIIRPFDTTNLGTVVYSVVMDNNGNTSIDWSRTAGAGAPAPSATVPGGLLKPGSSVIVAAINYQYTPLFGSGVVGSISISDTAYLRPRKQAVVALVP